MSRTKISWADFSWNPIIGCSKTSVGCANCYAERMAARQMWMEISRCEKNPKRCHKDWMKYSKVIHAGTGKWKGKTHFIDSALTKPLHWKKPRKIFVVSMGDLFHESVPVEWIDRVFAVMALCPQHEFKVLTKRAGRMREYIGGERFREIGSRMLAEFANHPGYPKIHMLAKQMFPADCRKGDVDTEDLPHLWPLPNVHLGVTVENQENVNRVDDLVRTPAAKRFISIEPMLEDIAFRKRRLEHIDCVYIGCESKGPPERLCTLDDMMHQMKRCWRAGVKIHVKQIPLNGRCNKNIDEWPEEFRIREV